MKKLTVVLAALAIIAIAAPTTAGAMDSMEKGEKMHHKMKHHGTHHMKHHDKMMKHDKT